MAADGRSLPAGRREGDVSPQALMTRRELCSLSWWSSGRAELGPVSKVDFYARGVTRKQLWSRFAGRNQPVPKV